MENTRRNRRVGCKTEVLADTLFAGNKTPDVNKLTTKKNVKTLATSVNFSIFILNLPK